MASNNDKAQTDARYRTALTRRESLKWLGLLSASVVVPPVLASSLKGNSAGKGHWPNMSLKPITGKGYGKDPNLIVPPEAPWPLILAPRELETVALLSELVVPREGNVPSARELKVPDVVNEWVSAPYAGQQRDRDSILRLIGWLEDEARLRFDKGFLVAGDAQRLSIIDDIAYKKALASPEFSRPAAAFARLRALILAAFFCTPQGTKDIGYLGNVPIAGDYPGPSQEAMQHLHGLLDELALGL